MRLSSAIVLTGNVISSLLELDFFFDGSEVRNIKAGTLSKEWSMRQKVLLYLYINIMIL